MIVLPGLNCPGLALDEPNLTRRQVEYMVAIAQGCRGVADLSRYFCVSPNAGMAHIRALVRKGRVHQPKGTQNTLKIIRPLQWREIA